MRAYHAKITNDLICRDLIKVPLKLNYIGYVM